MPYKALSCLGSGFFGEVWLEQDLGLDRLCAAKYLSPARLPAGMVFAEARVMLDGEHDIVVRVFSADTKAGIPVIPMEYLPAGSVARAARLPRCGPMFAGFRARQARRGMRGGTCGGAPIAPGLAPLLSLEIPRHRGLARGRGRRSRRRLGIPP